MSSTFKCHLVHWSRNEVRKIRGDVFTKCDLSIKLSKRGAVLDENDSVSGDGWPVKWLASD